MQHIIVKKTSLILLLPPQKNWIHEIGGWWLDSKVVKSPIAWSNGGMMNIMSVYKSCPNLELIWRNCNVSPQISPQINSLTPWSVPKVLKKKWGDLGFKGLKKRVKTLKLGPTCQIVHWRTSTMRKGIPIHASPILFTLEIFLLWLSWL